MIIGGIAVGLLGKPHLTVDIDVVFLLSLDDIPLLLQNAEAEGFEPRMDAVEQFARKTRVVLLKHIASNINVDISLGVLPFEEEMVQLEYWVKVFAEALDAPELWEDLKSILTKRF